MSGIKSFGFDADELAQLLDLDFGGYGSFQGMEALEKHFGSNDEAFKEVMKFRKEKKTPVVKGDHVGRRTQDGRETHTIGHVMISGRPVSMGITLCDIKRGWINIEGEQFAVKRVGKHWEIIDKAL